MTEIKKTATKFWYNLDENKKRAVGTSQRHLRGIVDKNKGVLNAKIQLFRPVDPKIC